VIEFGPGSEKRYATTACRADPGPNTIWGPFGRNLHEDLLGVHGQGIAMREKATDSKWVLHGREENNTIHDEVGMRHFYANGASECNARPTIRWETTRSQQLPDLLSSVRRRPST